MYVPLIPETRVEGNKERFWRSDVKGTEEKRMKQET